MIREVQEFMSNFHVALKCLHILTQDLPQYPLGRHVSLNNVCHGAIYLQSTKQILVK